MTTLRNPAPFVLATLLSAALVPCGYAQTPFPGNDSALVHAPEPVPTLRASAEAPPAHILPGTTPVAASAHAPDPQPEGNITGVILDADGAQVEGAIVILKSSRSENPRTATTDSDGLFAFNAPDPGAFAITVVSDGFNDWLSDELVVEKGQHFELPPVTLHAAVVSTVIQVHLTRHDIAEDQMAAEEKQRVLGAIPNFYVSYTRDAVPLSTGQKFRLAYRTAIDPVTIGFSVVVAGVEQQQNSFAGYGQGVQGYAKRFGANYGDGFIGNMLTDAVLPSVFHQDPRYFYKGTGTISSRALYAVSTIVVCRGDNGRWQPNYSNVLGNLAAAGISNIYYPASDRHGAQLTIQNSLVSSALGGVGNLFQEFVVRHFTRGLNP